MRIAITGGIGSGKSVVAKIISELGGYVLSADEINKQLLNDKNYIKIIDNNFPNIVENGIVNKPKLKQLIISDKTAQHRLNSISHPIIREEIIRQSNASGKNKIFVEIPLLVESGMKDIFDVIWLVVADSYLRLKRIVERDDVTKDTATALINSQASEDEQRQIATHIIYNDSTYDELCEKVEKMYRLLK